MRRLAERTADLCDDVGVTRELVAKPRPDRFTAMSGKMAAVVGYILDERCSDPALRRRQAALERPRFSAAADRKWTPG